MRASLLLPPALIILADILTATAHAEVRLGKNVRVGGHDFSNQTFNAKRRAEIHLYDGKPAREGCVWKKDGKGGKVKVCHLQTRPDRRKN